MLKLIRYKFHFENCLHYSDIRGIMYLHLLSLKKCRNYLKFDSSPLIKSGVSSHKCYEEQNIHRPHHSDGVHDVLDYHAKGHELHVPAGLWWRNDVAG